MLNDNLYWLCLLSCEVLYYDPTLAGLYPWQRWGDGFNGLHILTGFHSLAQTATGFPNRFANDMLVGSAHRPMTIVQAWRSAAKARGTGAPAALGPIERHGFSDFNDHYWGKGFVGPSIPRSLIRGWWYIN